LPVPSIEGLRQIHQRYKLPAISKVILSARVAGKPGHIVVTEVAGILPATQQLAEGGLTGALYLKGGSDAAKSLTTDRDEYCWIRGNPESKRCK